MTDASDYYEVLEVESTCTRQQIRDSYRRLVRESHPDLVAPCDRFAAEELTKTLNAAYAVLGDDTLRARYDADRRFVRSEAEQLARERADAEAEAHRERSERLRARVDALVREQGASRPAPAADWHPERTALPLTVSAPKERLEDLRAELKMHAERAGLSLKEAGVYDRGRRGKVRLLLEGDLKEVRRYLRWLQERFEKEPGPWRRRPRLSIWGPYP